MCQKVKKTWECGHSQTEDPRRCRVAYHRNKSACQDYGFAWAFRDPVVENKGGECCTCHHAHAERARKDANQMFVEKSQAYPCLRDVSTHDDATRRESGRPRFDRRNSNSEIAIPPGWTPAQNRLPSNANEYEQFVRGRFNPLQHLPDSHLPPQLPGEILYGGPRPLPPPGADNTQVQNTQHFQPQPNAFTKQGRAGSQSYRSRPPPPGYAAQLPHDVRIARYHIARHERAQITPPHHDMDAVVLEDSEATHGECRRKSKGGRRPSKTSSEQGSGWVPPTLNPLPPKQAPDTATPPQTLAGRLTASHLSA